MDFRFKAPVDRRCFLHIYQRLGDSFLLCYEKYPKTIGKDYAVFHVDKLLFHLYNYVINIKEL